VNEQRRPAGRRHERGDSALGQTRVVDHGAGHAGSSEWRSRFNLSGERLMKRIARGLAALALVAGITGCGGSSSGGGSGAYQSDYDQGYSTGQQTRANFNVMPSPSQCGQLWGLVKARAQAQYQGQALTSFRAWLHGRL
jgi:hypothetical protein